MSEERDFEKEARADGWVPKEEWKGPDERWADAKTFVEKGEKIAGILKSKIERLEAANAEFGQFHRSEIARREQENKRLIAELEEARKKAVTDGDGEAFAKADKQIKDLEAPKTNGSADAHAQLAQSWAASNQWYGANDKLTGYADGIAERVINEGYTGKAYFNELTRRVKESFPEEFGNPNRSRPNGVETDTSKSGKGKGKTYDDLPPDAKAACDRFVKGGFMKKEDYLKSFEWDV